MKKMRQAISDNMLILPVVRTLMSISDGLPGQLVAFSRHGTIS